MKIVVCVKQVAVLGDDIEFTADHRDIDRDYLDFALNEWDTFATEEALRLREALGGEVVAVTVGDADAEDALHRCLAMGADRAVRIWNDGLGSLDPIRVARALAVVVSEEQPDLVLCGAQSSDAVEGATGVALAALLDLPSVAVVKKVEPAADAGSVVVDRELEGGLVEVLDVTLPALLTIQTGINEPRYVTLRAMQQAKQSPLPVVEPGDLGDGAYRVRRMHTPERVRAQMLAGRAPDIAARIAELVREAAR